MTIEEMQSSCTAQVRGDLVEQRRLFTLGLCGEHGELIEAHQLLLSMGVSIGKIAGEEKKVWRGNRERNLDAVREEVADILIYASLYANTLGFSLQDAVKAKLQRVEERIKTGYYTKSESR